MEIILALHNIRSVYNVGAILRSCEGFGVKKIIYSGFTPTPAPYAKSLPHLAEKITKQLNKTALGAETISGEYSTDLINTLRSYKEHGYQILGLENNLIDQRLYQIPDESLKTRLENRLIVIVGEEVTGISSELYPLIDLFLEIPMHGKKESFNVSVATAILLFYLTTLGKT